MKNVLLIQTGGTIAMDISGDNNPRLDAAKGTGIIYQKIPELLRLHKSRPSVHSLKIAPISAAMNGCCLLNA